ncbi:hypothetical protein DSL72_004368 [Monilinia vaccinii-corymbosi]|uniref:Uncharacterized protein n=1 Tax=Monilinia vaccinii-corymbosi TaxID=61207 RepID=A0A8A3P0B5_9HELO|nr:hypothetical protein DSL72_004368 [Monilinia vaccinii-corymbosi]
MLQVSTFPNGVEASGGNNAIENREEGQIVGPLLKAYCVPILHRQRSRTPDRQKSLRIRCIVAETVPGSDKEAEIASKAAKADPLVVTGL